MLKQGKRTAEEVIMEFRLLIAEAGYSSDTPSDNLHLIEKLQDALNPSLTLRRSYPLIFPLPCLRMDEKASRIMQSSRHIPGTMQTSSREQDPLS